MANNLDFTFTGKDKTQSAFRTLNRSISKTQKGFDRLKKAIGWMSTAGGVASLGALVAFSKNMLTVGDRIGKVSTQIGISAEALQRLQFAGEQSGVSTESMNKSLQKFSRSIGEANSGMKLQKEAFYELGVVTKDLNGVTRPTVEILMDVVEALDKETDMARKAKLASDLFGRSGVELVPFLEQGKQGIKELGDQLERYGGILSDEAIEHTQDFNDQLNLLGKTSRQAFNPIVRALNRTLKALMGPETKDLDPFKVAGKSTKELEKRLKVINKEFAELSAVYLDHIKDQEKWSKWTAKGLIAINKATKLEGKLLKLRNESNAVSFQIGKNIETQNKEQKKKTALAEQGFRVENLGIEAVNKQKQIGKKLTEETIEGVKSIYRFTLTLLDSEGEKLGVVKGLTQEQAEQLLQARKLTKLTETQEKALKKALKIEKEQTRELEKNKEIAQAFVGGIRSASAQATRFFDAIGLQIQEVGKSIELTFSTNWMAIIARFALSSKKVRGLVDRVFSTFGNAIDSIFDKLLPGLGDANDVIFETGNKIGEVLEIVESLGKEIDDYNMTISGITGEAREMALIEKQYVENKRKADDLGSGFLRWVASLTKQQAILARTTERVARATEAFKQSASSYINALETAGFTDLQKDLFLQAKGFITGPMQIFNGIIEDANSILTTVETRLPTAQAEKEVLQKFMDEESFEKKKQIAKSSDFLMEILGDQLAIIEKGVDKSDFIKDVKVLGIKVGEKFDATGFMQAVAKYNEAVLAFGKVIPDKQMELLNEEIKTLTESFNLQTGIVTTNTDLMNKAQGGLLEMVKATIKSEYESGKSKEAILADIEVVSAKLKEAGLDVSAIQEYVENLASGAMGGLFKKYPYGGKIFGPSHAGGGVNANLEGGEFVMSRSAVKQYGSQFMSDVNQGQYGENGNGVEVSVYLDMEGQVKLPLHQYISSVQSRAERSGNPQLAGILAG